MNGIFGYYQYENELYHSNKLTKNKFLKISLKVKFSLS